MSDPQLRRTLITIQAPVGSRDPQTNEKGRDWAFYKECFVQVTPRRGKERFEARSQESVVTHVLRGHYFDSIGVTADMRVILEDTRVLNIIASRPDHEMKEEWMIDCEETDETP